MTMQEKIKQFFNIKDKSASQNAGFNKTKPEEFVLNMEIYREIGPEAPINSRLKILKRLSDELHGKRMEDDTVAALFNLVKDLLEPQQAQINRQAAFAFLVSLVQSQYEWLYIMRAVIFKLIYEHRSSEDLEERLELLDALSKQGREIEHFEDEIGPFVMKFTNRALSSSSALLYLKILVNLFKFHSVYLNKDIVKQVVWIVCHYACHTASHEGVMLFLQVLDSIIAYSYLPSDAMECMIVTMCRIVNVEKFSLPAWRLVQKMLGTHLGHSGVYMLCSLLENRGEVDVDVLLMRGAVFYIGMCLWGSQKVAALKFTHLAVLPYLLQALKCEHYVVYLEVTLSMQRLTKKYGHELHLESWGLALDILETLITFTENKSTATTDAAIISSLVHDIISTVEELQDTIKYQGCERRFYDIVARCANKLPDSSIVKLISYKAEDIYPVKSLWLTNLLQLVDLYYRQEHRSAIRIKMLDVINEVLENNRELYEDEIVERIIIPSLCHVESDPDPVVRNAAVRLLVNVAHDCKNKSCLAAVDILGNVILSPFAVPDAANEGDAPVNVTVQSSDLEFEEVKTAITGLILLFEDKVYALPSAIATNVFKYLVMFVDAQYSETCTFVSKHINAIRIQILELLLKLRANERFQIGLPDKTGVMKFSRYLVCSRGEKHNYGAISPPPVSSPTVFVYPQCTPTEIAFDSLFATLSHCLHKEKDWTVLRVLLLELPKLLQNKTLLLSTAGVVGDLCHDVCSLLADRNLKLPETLRNAPVTLSRSEFNMHVYPVQVALVSYHRYVETGLQVVLVTCLKKGLSSKTSRPCIVALTVCILEMTDTMYKLLPDVLLALSRISATLNIANPILEFLSTLTRLPKLYASFVQDQYMSIFAIALPYTNPFRFNHYTVSLAHHVISMWFIKCKLPFRKEFSKFVIKGLKNNIIVPINEENSFAELRAAQDSNPEVRQRLINYHKDLTETCIDLLTRYTFACLSTLPKRTSVAQFLLRSGQSLSWIIGSAVVTVTTSGCCVKSSKNGMCDKCYLCCKGPEPAEGGDASQATAAKASESAEELQTRRRHRSAAIRSTSLKVNKEDLIKTKDDMQLNKAGKRSTTGGEGDAKGDDDDGGPETRICSCWCQGWAEIMVRRPTGNTSWLMRIQNQLQPDVVADFPLSDVSELLFSHHLRQRPTEEEPETPLKKNLTKFGHERIDSENETDVDSAAIIQQLSKLETIDDVLLAADASSAEDHEREMKNEATAKLQQGFMTPEKTTLTKSNSSPDLKQAEQAEEDKSRRLKEKGVLTPSPATKGPKEVTSTGASTSQVTDTKVGDGKWKRRTETSPLSKLQLQRETQSQAAKPAAAAASELKFLANLEERTGAIPRRATWVAQHPPLRSGVGQPRPQSGQVYRTPSVPNSPQPLSQPGLVVDELAPIQRERGHTISVMSPARHRWLPGVTDPEQEQDKVQLQGIEPRFVFMQLFYSFRFGATTDLPILVPHTEAVIRTLKVLDRIPPYDTHKIGVVYVGPDQVNNEAEILGNDFGSDRYVSFIHGIGRMVRLQDVNPKELYVGGLELGGKDGKFAYVWQDDVMQVIYHIATLMPSRETDPNSNQKKLHIGNNFVLIVYNDSGEEFKMGTIRSQFIFACIVIKPLDRESNLVTVKTKPELVQFLGNNEPCIVSDHNLSTLARQLALHANLASMILMKQERQPVEPYATNWLERLRHISRMREKRLAEAPPPRREDSPPGEAAWLREMDDFTKFV